MRWPTDPIHKMHGPAIMHYLLRHPCATAPEIILALEGNHQTIRTRLKELEEEGFITSFFSIKSRAYKYQIEDVWLKLALSFSTERLQW